MSDSVLSDLNAYELRQLFDEPIYLIPEKIHEKNESAKNIELSAENRKQILVVHAETDDNYHHEINQELLKNILKAIGLNPDSVLQWLAPSTELRDLISKLDEVENNIAICFGWFPLDQNPEKYLTIETQYDRILYVDQLDDVRNDRQKKIKLWGQLKGLFTK